MTSTSHFRIEIDEKGILSSSPDSIIYVWEKKGKISGPEDLVKIINEHRMIDAGVDSEVCVIPAKLPAGRIISSPVGQLSDYDDVRSFYGAGVKAMKRAMEAHSNKPLLILPHCDKFPNTELVTLLGVLESIYVPIQLREDKENVKTDYKVIGINTIYIWCDDRQLLENIHKAAYTLESGRCIARDIGGGDPERMSPPNIEEYVTKLFQRTDGEHSNIKVEVVKDRKVFEKEYPLFAAVDRAASVTERHSGRIIYLKYEPSHGEAINQTLALIGKGITYDTGGANVKINGAMTGMSRDKCGAAAVVGFMKVVSKLQPLNLRVIGALCLARNSIGENSYVSDEVITARSKRRVRIENTDAEGRMVMADVLCKLKEDLQSYPNVHIMTIATLTGHAWLSVGNYSIVMDNSVARKNGNGSKLQEAGESIGDLFEISILRKEDIKFHEGKWKGDDVHQSAGGPSTKTSRGHQGPAGFLMLASGLDKHELSSPKPISYSHLDIAGSAGSPPKEPTGTPILALAAQFLKFELRLK